MPELVSVVAVVISRSSMAYADGWGFATVRDVTSHKQIKIVGSLEGIQEQMTVSLEGSWVKHDKYGMQIKIERIWEDDPRNEEGMAAWMVKRLPQIGPVRAEEIIRHFGAAKMFEVIAKKAHRLLEISGITQERADEIVRAYDTYRMEQETFIGLYRLGFSKTEANRIMKVWDSPLSSIKENPFELYGEVPGLNFRRLDEVREEIGLPDNMPERICTALVDRAKRRCQERGHTVSDLYDFVIDTADWIEQDEEEVLEHMGDMVNDGALAFFEGGVMLQSTNNDEEKIATKIKELLRVGQQRDELQRARENTEADEASSETEAAGGDGQDLEDGGPPLAPAAHGAAPGINPDPAAFSPAYWGAQGRGLFDPGQGSSQSQSHDAQGADGSGDGGSGNGEDHNAETDPG